MAVPQLQYATMPVVQPRSEMQGFSNALLQAGAMRQDRLKAEQERADRLGQQQFQNNLATQQFGLQQKADARAEQAQEWQGQRHVADMAELQAQAMQRQKDEASKQWLSMPENAKRYAELEAKGDELGKLAFLEEGFIATNNFDGDKLMKVGDQKLQTMAALDAKETNALQRAKYRMDMAHTQLQMATERMKQAAPMGGMDSKLAGQMQDNIWQQISQMNGNLQKAQSEQGAFGRIIASKPTVESLKAISAGLDPQSQAFAEAQRIIRMFDGKPSDEAQARMIADELSQLNALVDKRQKEIDYYTQKGVPELTAQLNALQQFQVPGLAAVSPIPTQEWMAGPQVAPAPERSWMDAAIDLFGQWSAKGNIASQRERRGETPPSTTFKAKSDAMNLPTSDEPRPSKATLEGRISSMMGAETRSARDAEIADLEAQIRRAESVANTPADFNDPIMGPLNREAMYQNKAQADKLRKELEELKKKPVKSSTYKELRGREPFTGTY